MYLPYFKLWTQQYVCLLACSLLSWFISPQESIEKATLFQGLQYVYNICVYFFRVLSREGSGRSSFFFFSYQLTLLSFLRKRKKPLQGASINVEEQRGEVKGHFSLQQPCSGLYTTGYFKASTNASFGSLLTNEMWEYFPDCHLKQNFCKKLTLGCGTVDHS